MLDENTANSIGDPKPIDARQGRAILKRTAAVIGVSVGGILAFSVMVMPHRLQGASRSARLLWQQRQKEVQQAVASALPAETNTAAAVAADQPPSAPRP